MKDNWGSVGADTCWVDDVRFEYECEAGENCETGTILCGGDPAPSSEVSESEPEGGCFGK